MLSRYKRDFSSSKYLDFITEKKFKIALTKFRFSSHDLATERGRYVNIQEMKDCANIAI